MSQKVYIAPYGTIAAHDRTAKQSAVIYTANGGVQTALTIPSGATFARIVPISGGNILVEIAGGGATAHNVDLGSPLFSGSALEHFIPLPPVPSFKIAGETGTVTFQLSWVQ